MGPSEPLRTPQNPSRGPNTFQDHSEQLRIAARPLRTAQDPSGPLRILQDLSESFRTPQDFSGPLGSSQDLSKHHLKQLWITQDPARPTQEHFEQLRNVLSGPEEVSRVYVGSEESLNAPENPDVSKRGSEVS